MGRPNIVLILADDLGYGDVQALNPASTIPTPHLNALASQAVTFSDAHAPAAVCTPTRYGLLTGRYCWRSRLKSGVLGGYSEPLLEPGRSTVADLLQQQGYRTAAVGKWHLGLALPFHQQEPDLRPWDGDPGVDFAGRISDGPLQHGFQSYFGVSASLDMPPYVYIRDDRFASQPTLSQAAVSFPHFVRSGPRAEDFILAGVLDRLTEEAVAFIGEASAGAAPYFLYLPLTGPHKPTQPHERFRGKTQRGEYGDFVHQVDWTVGQLLAAIDRSGQADNTLVLFTSDNGSYMYRYDEADRQDHVDDPTIQGFRAEHHRANGPWRGTKADIWEAGHRVPFWVRWPGRLPAGTTCAATICLTDIYATCADLLGVELGNEQAEDSVSLWPLLLGEAESRGVPVVHHSVQGMFAIRQDRWKLVCGTGSGGRQKPQGKPFEQPYQLYDVQHDATESQDVAAEHPEVVADLTAVLQDIRDEGETRTFQ
ncbi:MAG: arylsulfatase [Planctomycetales bacterium]|nr:arylsulfatase [Planctomycetales bacterium]